jgi:hypothetical protein
MPPRDSKKNSVWGLTLVLFVWTLIVNKENLPTHPPNAAVPQRQFDAIFLFLKVFHCVTLVPLFVLVDSHQHPCCPSDMQRSVKDMEYFRECGHIFNSMTHNKLSLIAMSCCFLCSLDWPLSHHRWLRAGLPWTPHVLRTGMPRCLRHSTDRRHTCFIAISAILICYQLLKFRFVPCQGEHHVQSSVL